MTYYIYINIKLQFANVSMEKRSTLANGKEGSKGETPNCQPLLRAGAWKSNLLLDSFVKETCKSNSCKLLYHTSPIVCKRDLQIKFMQIVVPHIANRLQKRPATQIHANFCTRESSGGARRGMRAARWRLSRVTPRCAPCAGAAVSCTSTTRFPYAPHLPTTGTGHVCAQRFRHPN